MDSWKLTVGHIENDQISLTEHLPAGYNLDWPA